MSSRSMLLRVSYGREEGGMIGLKVVGRGREKREEMKRNRVVGQRVMEEGEEEVKERCGEGL